MSRIKVGDKLKPFKLTNIQGKEIDTIKSITKELGITFPILLDKGLNIYNQYGVSALPSFILMDKQGIIKYLLHGFPSHSAKSIIQTEVDNILKVSLLNNNLAKH